MEDNNWTFFIKREGKKIGNFVKLCSLLKNDKGREGERENWQFFKTQSRGRKKREKGREITMWDSFLKETEKDGQLASYCNREREMEKKEIKSITINLKRERDREKEFTIDNSLLRER